MPWPVHPTGFFGAQGDNDTYKIERSLRFNSADSAYLSRTPASVGNRRTWTWSGWVKKTSIETTSSIYDRPLFWASGITAFRFESGTDSLLRFFSYSGGSYTWQIQTTQSFRDVSGWYHVVIAFDTTQSTSSNRVKIYINGSQVTSLSSSSYPSLNFDSDINNTVEHRIGSQNTTSYFDGYLTEINFIDGQALTPSSFGETDAITGRWKAKAYSGTYGTNGFYLKFADNSGTTATTLGKDSSGNGNNWTPNNFSVTAGVGNDSLLDSPTNNGTSGNYCTLNPLDRSGTTYTPTINNGNLDFTASGSNAFSPCRGTIFASTGKWYFETTITNNGTFSGQVGISNNYNIYSLNGDNSVSSGIGAAWDGRGFLYFTGSNSAYSPTFTTNDVISCAYDVDAGKIWFRKNNGSWYDSSGGTTGDPATGANPVYNYTAGISIAPFINGVATHTQTLNFGQRPFAYTAPSGFKALCTTNLPTPTIRKPSSYMDVVTYTGNGSAQTISSLGFSPDLVWAKGRSVAYDHGLFDVIRGATVMLSSGSTGAEGSFGNVSQTLTAFNSNGFTLGSNGTFNQNSATFVAWAWDAGSSSVTNNSGSITSTVRANAQDGVSIVSANYTSGTQSYGHGLGAKPAMYIVKNRNASQNWQIWHKSLSNETTAYLQFNTSGEQTFSNMWSPSTTTTISLATGPVSAGDNFIAYVFAEVEGFSRFGSYTGNGSSDGPFVFTGHRPRWVMIKRTDAASQWFVLDTARNTFNVADGILRANASDSESTGTGVIDVLSNGFKLRHNASVYSVNENGGSFIFAAFAETAFRYARAR